MATQKTEFFTIQRYEILRRVAETEDGKAKAGELETSCMICLEDFKDDDDVALMRGCFHVFHIPCICQVIERNFCKEVFMQWADLPLEYDPADPDRRVYKVFDFNTSGQCFIPGLIPVAKKQFMGQVLANVLYPIVQPIQLDPGLSLEDIAELRYFDLVLPLYEANGYSVPVFARLPPDYDSLRAIDQQEQPVDEIAEMRLDQVARFRQHQHARRERRIELFELGFPSVIDVGLVGLLAHVAPVLASGTPLVLMSLIVPPILIMLNRYRRGLNPHQRNRHVTFMGVVLILFLLVLQLGGFLGVKPTKNTFDMLLYTVPECKALWEELPSLSDDDFIIRMKELIPSTFDAQVANLFEKYTVKQLYSKLNMIMDIPSTPSRRKKINKRQSRKRRSLKQ